MASPTLCRKNKNILNKKDNTTPLYTSQKSCIGQPLPSLIVNLIGNYKWQPEQQEQQEQQ